MSICGVFFCLGSGFYNAGAASANPRKNILLFFEKLLQNLLTIHRKSCIIYTVVIKAARESGGTGRRARLRGVWFTPYGFKSRFSHHSHSIKMQLCQKSLAMQGSFDFLKVSKHPFSTVQLFPNKRDLNPRHFGKIEKILVF